jgi:hypothetical protein
MRRLLPTSLALAASLVALSALPATAAETPLTLTKVRADWIGSQHRIFVESTWTPKRFETEVTVRISVAGQDVRTFHVKRWLIGRKIYRLTVPESVPADSRARIEVRISSKAGKAKRVVFLGLPDGSEPPAA